MKQLLIMAIAIMTAACDPGYRYVPQGWPQGQPYLFDHTESSFRLRIRAIDGLIGQQSIAVEAHIHSLAQDPIVFEQPELISRGVVYAGRYFGPDRPRSFTVRGGGEAQLRLTFEFPKPLYEVLDEHITFRVGYRVGKGDRQEFNVTLTRRESRPER